MLQDSNLKNSFQHKYEYNIEKPIYETAPVARNTIENNQVKIINYRNRKLISFNVDNRQLICLPQAFDYFLKNFIGGLHTVYTKLKRLDIIPIVCNVEQVRILRNLTAIQSGVNRCKLLAPHEFDILYNDCTNSGSRPGRPPKRNISYEKRLKFTSNFLFHSNSNFNQYLFNSSPFKQTLSHSYLSNNTQSLVLNSSDKSRSFTIDAMLNHNRDRLVKPIDQSMSINEQTVTSINYNHMKNMIKLTVENARLREKQLENEIVDLKNEITKEQDNRQKLEQDFFQLQHFRNILIKKIKRFK